jgi:hypothetical protein
MQLIKIEDYNKMLSKVEELLLRLEELEKRTRPIKTVEEKERKKQ